MNLPWRDLKRCLTGKLGCQERTGKHLFFDLIEGGQVIATTKMSHNQNPLGDPLQGAMAKQLGVPKPTFVDAVKCSVSRQAFIEARSEHSG